MAKKSTGPAGKQAKVISGQGPQEIVVHLAPTPVKPSEMKRPALLEAFIDDPTDEETFEAMQEKLPYVVEFGGKIQVQETLDVAADIADGGKVPKLYDLHSGGFGKVIHVSQWGRGNREASPIDGSLIKRNGTDGANLNWKEVSQERRQLVWLRFNHENYAEGSKPDPEDVIDQLSGDTALTRRWQLVEALWNSLSEGEKSKVREELVFKPAGDKQKKQGSGSQSQSQLSDLELFYKIKDLVVSATNTFKTKDLEQFVCRYRLRFTEAFLLNKELPWSSMPFPGIQVIRIYAGQAPFSIAVTNQLQELCTDDEAFLVLGSFRMSNSELFRRLQEKGYKNWPPRDPSATGIRGSSQTVANYFRDTFENSESCHD